MKVATFELISLPFEDLLARRPTLGNDEEEVVVVVDSEEVVVATEVDEMAVTGEDSIVEVAVDEVELVRTIGKKTRAF